jgi:hypothetical protein
MHAVYTRDANLAGFARDVSCREDIQEHFGMFFFQVTAVPQFYVEVPDTETHSNAKNAKSTAVSTSHWSKVM